MASARAVIQLTKLPIASVSTLTAATGFLCASRGLSRGLLAACAGTLLLAAGACALNEWQERGLDARMERTRRRPLPAGAVKPWEALVLATLLALGGTALLITACGLVPAGLGVLAMLWYNALYTPLKRVTAFAVIPGAVIGALPPAIGWTAAGGSLRDPRLFALAFFFFVWQVPHFWLLLFKHGEDYERAGFPSITRLFMRPQLARLTCVWMLCTAAASLLLWLYGLLTSALAPWALFAAGMVLAGFALDLLRSAGDDRSVRWGFLGINLYACLVMAVLACDALFTRH
jgi:protoheme IX farnesyltransferase